jgi:hypothetical protein
MNRNTLVHSLIFALSIAWGGCSDDGDGHGGSGGTGHGGGGHGGAATSSSTGDGGSGGTSSGPPQAPVMQSVEPMQGALHVVWENVTPDCETIELDRKKDAEAYMLAYTLIGQATSQHDTQATAPGTYCYKARCTKGDLVSPDSNELCGTP